MRQPSCLGIGLSSRDVGGGEPDRRRAGQNGGEELGEHALSVNPFDIDEQADAIYTALTMGDEERGRRAKALRETVNSNTIEDWVEAQIEDIQAYRERPR